MPSDADSHRGTASAETAAAAEPLLSPQLVLDAHMLRSWYVPADPQAVAALVPSGLSPLENRQAFVNQLVVDADEQTSGFGAYELSYAGPCVLDHDVGGFPAHWLSEYMNSNPHMRDYTAERGFPVSEGRTRLVRDGDLVTATTEVAGAPIVRTVARVGDRTTLLRGQIGYITEIAGSPVLGRYPFVAEIADPVEILSVEFLEPDHPIYALRPEQPLEIVFGLYARRISYAYPGGEERL
jgi:hypothetical protein